MKFPQIAAFASLLSALLPFPAGASQFRVLFTFKAYVTGGVPQGGVILGPSGTLYGETAAGGTAPCNAPFGDPRNGCGTVYSLSAKGGFKVLVSFHGPNGAYGTSRLTMVGNTLYGVTERGGTSNKGVIFSVNTDGSNFTLLHQFNGSDGSNPVGPLVPGPNGIFYGITAGGGPNFPRQSSGALFSLTSTGTYTVLYTFSESDGAIPTTMIMTPSGILVGGTSIGGPPNPNYCPVGCGVVFSFDPVTLQYIVLKTYDNLNGTSSPYIGSVDANGTIYGNDEDLFSINLTGDYQILAQTNPYDTGEIPASGPTLAPNGTLYGTYSQSALGGGSLYSYSPSTPGVLTLDIAFGSPQTGYTAYAQPLVLPNGDVIGTTNLTFGNNGGTIWEYTP